MIPSADAASIRQARLEFDILVARAARLGHLQISEVADTYVVAADQAELKNPRQCALTALVQALQQLPPQFFNAPRLWLVPQLDGFRCEPDESGGGRIGRMDDGTWLLEAPFGLLSVNTWVAAMAVVFHEQTKAWHLLNQKPQRSQKRAGDSGDDGDDRDAGDGDTDASLAELAFDLGHEELALEQALVDTDGALFALLQTPKLPYVHIHADLGPDAVAQRAQQHGLRIVAALAEMGLAQRPVHLWMGDPIVTDCLSPYVRELRHILWQWAQEHPQDLSADVQEVTSFASDDLFYALAHDFFASDTRLFGEKADADRSVGIVHGSRDGRYAEAAQGFEMIDTGRLDPGVCDARLVLPAPAGHAAPVVLRVASSGTPFDAEVTRTLMRTLAAQLTHVTVVCEAVGSRGLAGRVSLPQQFIAWGQNRCALPHTRFTPEHLTPLLAAPVDRKPAVTVPTYAVVDSLQAPGPTLLGYADTAAVINDAVWQRDASLPALDVAWAVVHSDHVANGRPTLEALASHAAFALSRLGQALAPVKAALQQDMAPGTASSRTAVPSTPAPPKPRGGAPARRIKA